MLNNTWFKLAVVSLMGIVISFVVLWGISQFGRYPVTNNGNSGYQYNWQYDQNMSGMNGNTQGNMGMGNMNMNGSMQGNMGMGSMNMNGNMQGNMGGMGMMDDMDMSGMGMMNGMM